MERWGPAEVGAVAGAGDAWGKGAGGRDGGDPGREVGEDEVVPWEVAGGVEVEAMRSRRSSWGGGVMNLL